jgi:hypothetical protein
MNWNDDDLVRLRTEMRLGFMVSRPTSYVKVTNVETRTPQQIMDELREADPETHAKLSEIVVLDAAGNPTPESVEILRALITKAVEGGTS